MCFDSIDVGRGGMNLSRVLKKTNLDRKNSLGLTSESFNDSYQRLSPQSKSNV